MKKRERQNSKNKKLIVVLFVVSLVFVIASMFLPFSKPVDVKEFDVIFIVDSSITAGFDIGTDALRFGSLSPGNSAKRNVDITNNYDFPLKIKVLISENIVDLIRADSDITVESGKNITIPVTLAIPKNFSDGNYTGKIRFEMYKFKG